MLGMSMFRPRTAQWISLLVPIWCIEWVLIMTMGHKINIGLGILFPRNVIILTCGLKILESIVKLQQGHTYKGDYR